MFATDPILPRGVRVPVGPGSAEILPSLDFETYSEAGYVWNAAKLKWDGPPGSNKRGLPAVGLRVYATHPTARVFTMSYDLADGRGKRRWHPGLPLPSDLFEYLASGGLIEAHNAMFERTIWRLVCQPKYGFPPVATVQWRCSAAKSRAWGLPGSLEQVGKVLKLPTQKDADGKRLMKIFSMPRNPTKKNPATFIRREDDPEQAELYDQYCDTDVEVEMAVSRRVPDLIPQELAFWQCDQNINERGIAINLTGAQDCAEIVTQTLDEFGREMAGLTGGILPSQVQQLVGWLAGQSVRTHSLDADALESLLAQESLTPSVRRVLEIRQLAGSASVKKVFAMLNHTTAEGRAHDLFVYHGARTGRDSHADLQPGNLPKAGPRVRWCEDFNCRRSYGALLQQCPWCSTSAVFSQEQEWSWRAVPDALEVIGRRSAAVVRYFYGDALLAVSGCVRGLFTAAPGHRLICSDYSSIEAVVTAMLAGEQWRIDAFRRREDIYLHGAAGVTGRTYEWYKQYEREHGQRHPDRGKLGKVAELALGFGGWINSWRQFDKTDNFNDSQVKLNILKWRDASPAVVELWGGQVRGKPWAPERFELHGLEGAAISAIQNPGQRFPYRMISYEVIDDVLYAILPSGRRIAYQHPQLHESDRWPGQLSISFETWNNNPKMGPMGWVRLDTYGSRLAENAVQAVARDIMAYAVMNAEERGYPIVLRVHDELAAEVPDGFGSVEEFEAIMCDLPWWAQDWPIHAAGGWSGAMFRKD